MGGEIVKTSAIGTIAVPDNPAGIDKLAEKFADVMHMEDVENVISAFEEQDELLRKAEEYGALRARYASLEAATYCKLSRKGWSKALGTPNKMRRRAAEWLASQGQKVYEQVIDGILSDKYSDLVDAFKRIAGEDALRSGYKHAIRYKRDCIGEYKQEGRTWLGFYGDYKDDLHDQTGEREEGEEEAEGFMVNRPNPLGCNRAKQHLDNALYEIAAMARDSTRIALRNAGAVGIGGGEYVDPDRFPEEVSKAVGIRKANIAACVMSLMALCKEAGFDFEHELEDALSMVGWPSERILASIDRARGGAAA